MGGLLATHPIQTICLTWLFLCPSQALHPQEWSYFILWNVGQGQWATLSTPSKCMHFDMGGERVQWPPIQRECQRKSNYLLLSHGDWDHISFIGSARYRLKRLCLYNQPHLTRRQKIFLKKVPRCRKLGGSPPVEKVFFHYHPPPQKKSNDNSDIFGLHNILIPGDSTAQMERIWLYKLRHSLYRTLILGHHGSQTSTSVDLLEVLPHLKQALTSSRKSKYGHPHSTIQNRLSQYGIPLLTTESWGTIRLPID